MFARSLPKLSVVGRVIIVIIIFGPEIINSFEGNFMSIHFGMYVGRRHNILFGTLLIELGNSLVMVHGGILH